MAEGNVELPDIPGGGTAEDMPGGVIDEGMPGGVTDGASVLGNFFATASGTSSPPEHANAQCEQRFIRICEELMFPKWPMCVLTPFWRD